jgi:hypothetical protein
MQESGSHQKVVPGDVEIEGLHPFQIFQVLFRDQGDGNVEDVHLILLDEMKQEIERAFKHLEPDRIRRFLL